MFLLEDNANFITGDISVSASERIIEGRSGFERFLFHNDDNPALPHSKILIIDIQAVLLLEGIITLYLIPCFDVIK